MSPGSRSSNPSTSTGLRKLFGAFVERTKEKLIPTDAKLWIVEQLIHAGFLRLEVTNFANPKRLPQFADAEELLLLIRTQRSIALPAVK